LKEAGYDSHASGAPVIPISCIEKQEAHEFKNPPSANFVDLHLGLTSVFSYESCSGIASP
jgi:hypothetical protein